MVRHGSAKAEYAGSIPAPISLFFMKTPAAVRSIRENSDRLPDGCVRLSDLAAAAGSIRSRPEELRDNALAGLLQRLLQDPDADIPQKARQSLLRLAA